MNFFLAEHCTNSILILSFEIYIMRVAAQAVRGKNRSLTTEIAASTRFLVLTEGAKRL